MSTIDSPSDSAKRPKRRKPKEYTGWLLVREIALLPVTAVYLLLSALPVGNKYKAEVSRNQPGSSQDN